ncbi:unnamed protein product [Moneuplotes crassus]|uniref:Uncharacterized protein n=1 Tax=Euplotes crassus TaxID=5936 RepID=A0AAD2D6P1_EUPCR|nr:unnamed protein product [Moneuplotes crassus]
MILCFLSLLLIISMAETRTGRTEFQKQQEAKIEESELTADPIIGGPNSKNAKVIFIQLRKLKRDRIKKRDDEEIIKDIQELLITGSVLTNVFKVDPYRAAIVVNDDESALIAIEALAAMREVLAVEYNNKRIFGDFCTKKEQRRYLKSLRKQVEYIKNEKPKVLPPTPEHTEDL